MNLKIISMGRSTAIFSTLLFLYVDFVFAQPSVLNPILNASVNKIPLCKINPVPPEQYFILPCNFGKDSIRFNDSININLVQVTAVDLVYTDYPSANDLKRLNGRRLKQFFKHYPSFSNDFGISWRLIRQQDGAQREKAMKMFHGFVVYFRPLQNKKTMDSDLIKLKDILAPVPETAHIKKHAFLSADTTHLRERYEIEPYTLVKKLPAKKALIYLGLEEKEITQYPNLDSLYVFEIPGTDSIIEKKQMKIPEDSTVINVLDRMPNWKNMVVVTDVTASMYPFTGQLLLWMKLHEDVREIRQFIFFNDGDELEEDKKIPGKTGGIYSTSSSVFEVVEKTAFTAMSNGNGGGIPENNIEALLRGINDCPLCNSLIMIADNNSPVSDMILLNKINRPVHIILCGVHETVNPDYLNIARVSGGSVHFMDKDIENLAAIKEGETIRIGSRDYTIKNGKFIWQK